MKSRAVIFDMDGVLVDTEPIYIDISKTLFRRLGVDFSIERHLSYVGICAERMWNEIRIDFGLAHTTVELVAMEKNEQLNRISELPALPPIPGIKELLERLHAIPAQCAIASSSSRELIELILRKSGLNTFFTATISGEDVRRGKPEPDIFLMAAESLQVDPEFCLVIEDSPHGIQGAKAAGMTACGFANPNSGEQDLMKADFIVHDFSAQSAKKIAQTVEAKMDGLTRACRGRADARR